MSLFSFALIKTIRDINKSLYFFRKVTTPEVSVQTLVRIILSGESLNTYKQLLGSLLSLEATRPHSQEELRAIVLQEVQITHK
jgi:hypothetical protein